MHHEIARDLSVTGSDSCEETKNCPLSNKNFPEFGDFSTSVLMNMGCTAINSFTEARWPFMEGVFLWITVLCIFVSFKTLRVFFCQCGRPIPLRVRVTAHSLGIALLEDIFTKFFYAVFIWNKRN